jgi:hypothetical protein
VGLKHLWVVAGTVACDHASLLTVITDVACCCVVAADADAADVIAAVTVLCMADGCVLQELVQRLQAAGQMNTLYIEITSSVFSAGAIKDSRAQG